MNRIRQLRKEKRMSQVYLSVKLEVAQGTISDYECGKSNPSVEHLIKLSEIFNVSCDYILGVSDIRSVMRSVETDEDVEIISQYHELSPLEKAMVKGYIQAFIDKKKY